MAESGTARNLRDELKKEDGTYPTSWRPRPGDIITGRVIKYTSATGNFGPVTICVLDEEESGERRSIWLMHEVLRREFEQQQPKPGERVGIKYLGVADKGYHKYKLMVDRPDAMPDFEKSATVDEVPGDFALAKQHKIDGELVDEDVPF